MANMTLTKTPMPEQEPNVRNRNFKEVSLGYTPEQAVEEAKRLMADGMSTNSAAKEVAKVTSFKKNDIYRALL